MDIIVDTFFHKYYIKNDRREDDMQVAGIREFRNRAPGFVKSKDLVFITRHGKLTSILVPLEEPQALPVDLRHELLERIGEAISMHLRKSGISEQRVLREFKTWREGNRTDRRRR